MGSVLEQLKRHRLVLVCLCAVVVIAAIATLLVVRYNAEHTPAVARTQGATPPFSAVLPNDRSIDALGGWQKLTPPSGVPYYVYVDTIDGVQINVSQQPLPDALKKNTAAQIADLAKNYNATTKLDADGTTVYLGTSAKGPQSVILTKNGLLVLIKSDETIANNSWTDYIRSLK